jgi:hypothetical protein
MDVERVQNEASALLGSSRGEDIGIVKGPGLSALSTSLNLIKMALGSGVLTLPYGVHQFMCYADYCCVKSCRICMCSIFSLAAFSQAGILGGVCDHALSVRCKLCHYTCACKITRCVYFPPDIDAYCLGVDELLGGAHAREVP